MVLFHLWVLFAESKQASEALITSFNMSLILQSKKHEFRHYLDNVWQVSLLNLYAVPLCSLPMNPWF
jgi:hypothetical protein